jgi:hypothetical protein
MIRAFGRSSYRRSFGQKQGLLRSFGVCVQVFSRCPSSPCFKKLIESNTSAKYGDLSDELGRTPLSYANLGEHIEVVKYLLQGHAEPNVEDDLGQTSLHLLTNNPMPELAELLIEAGADIYTRDKKGMCALHYAALLHKLYVALEKRFDLIIILVKKGVIIDCLTEVTVDLPATSTVPLTKTTTESILEE